MCCNINHCRLLGGMAQEQAFELIDDGEVFQSKFHVIAPREEVPVRNAVMVSCENAICVVIVRCRT